MRVTPSLAAVIGLAVVLPLSSPDAGSAAAPAQRFLEALRERGYYDVAEDYLEWLNKSSLATPAFRQTLGYELGVTLLERARTNRASPKVRDEQFDRAAAELDKFIKGNPTHELVPDAYSDLGRLYLIRSRLRMFDAERTKGDLRAAAADALKFLDLAEAAYNQRLKIVDDRLADLKKQEPFNPKKADHKPKIAQKNELLRNRLGAMFNLADLLWERAAVQKSDAAKYKTALAAAAAAYEKVYEGHKDYAGGLLARMWQARCSMEAKDFKKAVSLLDDCLGQPNEPQAYRDMKTQAIKLAMECWMSDQIKQVDKAIERGVEWLNLQAPDEAKDPNWLAVKYTLAQAYEKKAATPASKADDKKKSLQEALRLADPVSKLPNPLRDEARAMVARLRSAIGVQQAALPEPKTFAQAKERADDARDAAESGDQLVEKMEERMRTEKLEPAELAEVKKQAEALKKEVVKNRGDALKYYRLALAMTTPTTKPADRSAVMMYLTSILYNEKDYLSSIVLGEHLARTDLQGQGGLYGARVSLSSWIMLYNQATGDKSWETAGLKSICELIIKGFSDPRVSEDAYVQLIRILVGEGKIDEAMALMKKLDPNSPRYGSTLLQVAQGLSREYFRLRKLPADQQPKPEIMKQMIGGAKDLLTQGIGLMEKQGEVKPPLVSAAYTLAQIHLDLSEGEAAIKLFEHAKYGPLTLFRAKSPLVSPPNFKPEFHAQVLKLAIRGYISSDKMQSENLVKAQGILAELEKVVPKDQLGVYYRQMEAELRDQLQNAPEAQRKSIAVSYVELLKKIRDGKDGESLAMLYFVFSQLKSLADGMQKEGEAPSDQAKAYYSEAAATSQKALTLIESKKLEAKPEQIQYFQLQQARCLAKVGKYEDAIKELKAILDVKPQTITVQMEGARVYEEWGEVDPKNYRHAIGGGAFDQAKRTWVMWGYGNLAKRIVRYEQLRPTFFEAMLSMARCEYKYAAAVPAEKNKYSTKAKQTIFNLYQGYPELGGPEMKPKFDSLLKQVQRLRGEDPVGLKEFPDPRPKDIPAEKKPAETAARK